ncbi:MAG: MFS transporter [Anaerolineae bacterium]|jgi:MFS family permease
MKQGTLETHPSSRKTLKSLRWAVFWVSFPFGILSFVLPIYSKELGASALQVGGLFSAISLVPIVVRPLLGRALDRWGRRPFLLLGLSGYAVAMIVFCRARTVPVLTVARFVQGLGIAFLWLSAYTVVADIASETGRGRDFGSIDEAASRGALVGTTAGFFVIFTLQGFFDLEWEQIWFWIFAAYTVPAMLALCSGWRGVDETCPLAARQPIESRPVSGQLLALMVIVLLTGASSAMVWPLLMIFLQDALHADVSALATAYIPAALITSFLPSHMGRIADRVGRKGPMIAGLALGALASALIPYLGSVIALTVLWAVESLGYTASLPAERAFVADIAGEDVRGASYGLYTFAYFLGAALGPLVGGWLYDNLSHEMPFYLNTAVLSLGALLVAAVLREPRAAEANGSGFPVVGRG